MAVFAVGYKLPEKFGLAVTFNRSGFASGRWETYFFEHINIRYTKAGPRGVQNGFRKLDPGWTRGALYIPAMPRRSIIMNLRVRFPFFQPLPTYPSHPLSRTQHSSVG